MSDETARFSLPFLIPGQAQKELYHNEALLRIDAALQAMVEDSVTSVPPTSPVPGQCWIVSAGASGLWLGKDEQLAMWTSGGWRYIVPPAGMLVWNKAQGYWSHFNGSTWIEGVLPATALTVNGLQVVGERQPAIPSPSGGTIIDVEARVALGQITAALMSHGLIA